VVPKVCSVDPKGSEINSQGIRGYISVMDILELNYFLNHLNQRNIVLLKIIAGLLLLPMCLFRVTVVRLSN